MSRQTRVRFLIFSYVIILKIIDLFIPVAIPESDRLFNHAQSLQLAGDKRHTIWPGRFQVVVLLLLLSEERGKGFSETSWICSITSVLP